MDIDTPSKLHRVWQQELGAGIETSMRAAVLIVAVFPASPKRTLYACSPNSRASILSDGL